MSKGNPVIKCRVGHGTLQAIEAEVARLRESDSSLINTMSDFILDCIKERLNKRVRRSRSQKQARERRRREKESAQESAQIWTDMQLQLEKYR